MAFFAGSSSHKPTEELERLRGGRRTTRVILIGVAGLACVIFLIAGFLRQQASDSTSAKRARANLAQSRVVGAIALADAEQSCEGWIIRHGTSGELATFRAIAILLMQSAYSVGDVASGLEGGFVSRVSLGTHGAILRLVFLVIATWRIWIFAVLAAFIWALWESKVHLGDDVLGRTGNGRQYYTGIRVGLEKVTKSGAPEMQVPGLACPPTVSLTEARTSALARVLGDYDALNDTNLGLVAIILAHAEYSAYVADHGEEELLADFFQETTLGNSVPAILDTALRTHRAFQSGEQAPVVGVSSLDEKEDRITLEEYMPELSQALRRVLTPEMKSDLASLKATEVATAVLAHEAGKVLAYAYEGGRWRRASSFPQLSARAVLHSLPACARDYDFAMRQTLRRALIYGSRSSVFGPVRFSTDLSGESRSLRQWIELLMACPHELKAVSDDIELFAMVTSSHTAWREHFFGKMATLDADARAQMFATFTNLFIVPLELAVSLMNEILPDDQLHRLNELIILVSQRQRLRSMSMDVPSDTINTGIPAYERIFPPLDEGHVKELSKLHDIKEETLHKWSSYRVILMAFGWLARRVGDYTVPESSVIFAILRDVEDASESNEFGFTGKKGMVALRGTRMEDKWGRDWSSRFRRAGSANMAETEEQFGKLMRGIEDNVDDPMGTVALAG